MLLQRFHRGGNLLLRFLDLLGEGGPVQGDRRRVVSLGGAERLLGGDERLLERHALRLGLHELFFRTEETLTKRPRLLGRKTDTEKFPFSLFFHGFQQISGLKFQQKHFERC